MNTTTIDWGKFQLTGCIFVVDFGVYHGIGLLGLASVPNPGLNGIGLPGLESAPPLAKSCQRPCVITNTIQSILFQPQEYYCDHKTILYKCSLWIKVVFHSPKSTLSPSIHNEPITPRLRSTSSDSLSFLCIIAFYNTSCWLSTSNLTLTSSTLSCSSNP